MIVQARHEPRQRARGSVPSLAGAAAEAGRGYAARGASGKEGSPTVRKTAIGATADCAADLEPLPPRVGLDVLRSETAIPLSKRRPLSLIMTT